MYFASATRWQFYFDGNKRTARIMMTGALIQSGFEPVNIPYARQEELNVALDELFRTDHGTRLIEFLTTCTMPDEKQTRAGPWAPGADASERVSRSLHPTTRATRSVHRPTTGPKAAAPAPLRPNRAATTRSMSTGANSSTTLAAVGAQPFDVLQRQIAHGTNGRSHTSLVGSPTYPLQSAATHASRPTWGTLFASESGSSEEP